MIIGYARVSTTEQNLDLQRNDLKRAGCEKMIIDEICRAVGISRPTLYKYVAAAGDRRRPVGGTWFGKC